MELRYGQHLRVVRSAVTAIPSRLLAIRVSPDVRCAVVLVIFALIIRAPWIGNLLPHVDDQFYLLVADRMWQGLMPYVDIWDRKPVGLFLLYAALRPLSADGVVAYQTGSFVFAVATAFLIVRLGLRLGRHPAATAAGVLYLVYLPILGGNSGQSPVFYNLLTAIAALLIVQEKERQLSLKLGARAFIATAALGVAIQIKYTAFVEGLAFGLYLLRLQWVRSNRMRDVVALGCSLVGVALLPTCLVLGFYIWHGDGWAFFQANVLSIFQAKTPPGSSNLDNLALTIARLAFVATLAFVSVWLAFRKDTYKQTLPFFVLWAAFGLVDIVIIGRYYGHYALPALVPLTVLVVPVFENPIVAGLIVGSVFSFTFNVFVREAAVTKARNRTYVTEMVAALMPYRDAGCIYLRDGPSIVYMLARSCLPSRFVFPEHLSTALEAGATDATASMAALLAQRPPAISVSDKPPFRLPNATTKAMLEAALVEHYHLHRIVTEPNGIDHQRVYARNDLR